MADPAVTEPGGTSRITAEVVNPDGVPLTFSWVASGGSISGAEAQALWVAPQSTGEFTISVVIKDSKGRTASGSIGVYVQAASSSKPAPTPTPTAPKITTLTADPTVTEPSGSSSITAEVANPDNVLLTFSWVASGGSITGAQAQALWVAPQSTGEFTISVVAKDSYGRTASGSIGVNVQASSPAPAPIPSPTGTRDPSIWPFASTSPWNHPIGTGAIYDTLVSTLNLNTANAYFNANSWTMSAWKASSSDPLRTVTVTNNRVTQSDPSAPGFCTNSGPGTVQIRIPANAVPSPPPTSPAGTDAHMQIMDPDGQTVWELYQARKDTDGINWRARDFVKNDLKKAGAGFPCWHGIVSYGGSSMGGLVRAGELLNGIPHALGLTIDGAHKNKNVTSPTYTGGRGYIWPASASDDLSAFGTTGNLYHGGLLAIPPSVKLDSVNFQTVQGRNVARALQLYGGYVYEGTGTTNAIIFRINYADRAEVPTSSAFNADMRLAASLLKVVSNNGPNSVGGGGTPLAPLPPPLAQIGHGGDVASYPWRTPDTSIPLAASVVVLLSSGVSATRRARNAVQRTTLPIRRRGFVRHAKRW